MEHKFNINVDTETLIKETQKRIADTIRTNLEAQVTSSLRVLFASKDTKDYLRNLTDISFTYKYPHSSKSDIGYLSESINSAITEYALSDESMEKMKKYIAANFEKHLEAACDVAMEHRAKKLAFEHVKTIDK